MPSGKIIEQNIAKKLRLQGWSLNDIVKELKVSKGSVSLWVKDIVLTEEQRVVLKNREIRGGEVGREAIKVRWQKYRELNPKPLKQPRWPQRSVDTFFHEWSSDMAYVLGFFAADGCMYKNRRGSCYIAFTSTDKELIEIVKRLMSVTNNIEEYEPGENWKRRYTIQIGSKKIYQQLLQLGFTSNKSLTMKLPPVPDVLLGHFVRGYLDGDGCVHHSIYKPKNRPSPVIILSLKFTSGSKEFLSALKNRLSSIVGVGEGCLCANGLAWDLSYSSKRDTRQLYKFVYPVDTVPCLTRKRDIYQKGLYVIEQGPVAQLV